MQIFFDLDGTLIDASDRQYQLYLDFAQTHGFSTINRSEYRALRRTGKKEKDFASKTFPEKSLDAYVQWRYLHIEDKEYLVLDKLYAGVKKLLSMLRANELYIVTNRHNKEALNQQLRDLKIDRFKEVIAVTEKTEAIRQRLTGHAVLVGDSEVEFVASRNLGLTFVAISYGVRSREFLAKMGAKTIVDSIADLTSFLRQRS